MTAAALVIGPDHPDSFAKNIAAGLRSHHVTSAVIDPYASFARIGNLRGFGRYGAAMREVAHRVGRAERCLIGRHIERQLKEHDPRLVISVIAFGPERIEQFRKVTPNAKWVLWYPDHIANLGAHRVFLAPYDRLFFKEPHLVEVLGARTRLPVHFLAEACNPDHHCSEEPRTDEERRWYDCDVAVAGNLYPYRLLILEALPRDLRLKIYGKPSRHRSPGFERLERAHTGQYVTGRNKALAFRGAKVVLNTMHYAELRGVNCRLFEATGCGGFVLSHTSPELRRYFEVGREIVAFDSQRELVEAIRHYLRADDERSSIAAAGQARAHGEHTYAHRLRELVRIAGVAGNPGFEGSDW